MTTPTLTPRDTPNAEGLYDICEPSPCSAQLTRSQAQVRPGHIRRAPRLLLQHDEPADAARVGPAAAGRGRVRARLGRQDQGRRQGGRLGRRRHARPVRQGQAARQLVHSPRHRQARPPPVPHERVRAHQPPHLRWHARAQPVHQEHHLLAVGEPESQREHYLLRRLGRQKDEKRRERSPGALCLCGLAHDTEGTDVFPQRVLGRLVCTASSRAELCTGWACPRQRQHCRASSVLSERRLPVLRPPSAWPDSH